MFEMNNFLNMRRLREHTYYCDMIYTANWEKKAEEGWLWVTNLHLGYYNEALGMLKSYQGKYGRTSVTIGQPMSPQEGMPVATMPNFCGIYVKNLKEEIQTLYHDMERWLNMDDETLSNPLAW